LIARIDSRPVTGGRRSAFPLLHFCVALLQVRSMRDSLCRTRLLLAVLNQLLLIPYILPVSYFTQQASALFHLSISAVEYALSNPLLRRPCARTRVMGGGQHASDWRSYSIGLMRR
jgi:hypothetical protein